MAHLLDRDSLEEALRRLNELLCLAGERADLYVVGGAVMCLVHRARPATRDVDAWFSNPTVVRRAAKRVAEDLHLPESWLNDAAKGFAPENGGYDEWLQLSHLTVCMADDRTLLAMKCAAARTAQDAADIRFLAERLQLRSSRDVLNVVLAYYPAEQLPVRTRLLLEEMFDDRA